MSKVYNTEFREALREIAQRVPRFKSPYDRVRIVEWCRRLAGTLENTIDESRKRNDYIQLLKIMMRGGRLHGVFLKKPPDNEIPRLSEAMANALCDACPHLPKPGPIEPIVSRQTPDGCAYIALRKLPNKGILCYMAVSPEDLRTSEAPSVEDDGKEGEGKGKDEAKGIGEDESKLEDRHRTRSVHKN